ncbi:MAG: SIMPL domain-containing protein [Desertimonas sp.]
MHRRHTRTARSGLVIALTAGVLALGAAGAAGSVGASTPTDPSPPATMVVVTELDSAIPPPPSVSFETVPADRISDDTDRVVSVIGRGTVSVTPDIATIWMGVQVQSPTTQDALDALGEKANALVATLTALGIADEDVQTAGLSLWPTYGDGGTVVEGYEASTNVNVTVRDLDRAGEVIDAAQGFVGDGFTLGGINFGSSDPEGSMQEARVEAIDSARRRAEQYAGAAGLEVGEVLQIIEQGSAEVMMARSDVAFDTAEAQAAVPIEAGQQELTATVTVVFELR